MLDDYYIFDVYDDAMNRAYLALFPLYFEQFVDHDLAGKAMRKNKPFAGLNEKDDMRKAKKKGYKKAFIVAFKSGKKIKLKDALK